MYAYEPLPFRRPLKWPHGAYVAVVVTVNMEAWEPVPQGPYPGGPDILPLPFLPEGVADYPNFTWREYGARVGIWRIIEVLERLGIKASATLNVTVGLKYPALVTELKRLGWELVAHSYGQPDMLVHYAHDPEGERQLIRKTLEGFAQVVGERPKGWLSPAFACTGNTARILAEEGLSFFCDFQNDDQPYLLRLGDAPSSETQGKALVAIPYTPELNDYPIYIRQGHTAEEFFQTIKDEFDVLYREGESNGRLMNIGLHPHVTGRAFRIGALERALRYLRDHDHVWFARRDEIAAWYLSEYAGKG